MANNLNTDSPYVMKEQDTDKRKLKPTTKAYNNIEFMNSHEARIIRIMSEFQEPMHRLHKNDIRGTILVFGSARSMSRVDWENTWNGLEKKLKFGDLDDSDRKTIEDRMSAMKKCQWMCPWVDIAENLCAKLTEWAMTDQRLHQSLQHLPDYFPTSPSGAPISVQPLVITTGGGPGLMEAANRGAASIKGAKTIGMGISLPFEKGLNPYVSDGLAFEFHYFFTRKFWMMYSAKALIVAPGGFGTMDELFELMTLRQTRKIPNIPIVLLGKSFWETVINWKALADFGVVSQQEIDALCFADDVETAFEFIRDYFTKVVLVIPLSPSMAPTVRDGASSSAPLLNLGSPNASPKAAPSSSSLGSN